MLTNSVYIHLRLVFDEGRLFRRSLAAPEVNTPPPLWLGKNVCHREHIPSVIHIHFYIFDIGTCIHNVYIKWRRIYVYNRLLWKPLFLWLKMLHNIFTVWWLTYMNVLMYVYTCQYVKICTDVNVWIHSCVVIALLFNPLLHWKKYPFFWRMGHGRMVRTLANESCLWDSNIMVSKPSPTHEALKKALTCCHCTVTRFNVSFILNDVTLHYQETWSDRSAHGFRKEDGLNMGEGSCELNLWFITLRSFCISSRNVETRISFIHVISTVHRLVLSVIFLIARFMGPTWGPPWAARTQVGPMLATRTLLSGIVVYVEELKFRHFLYPLLVAKNVFRLHTNKVSGIVGITYCSWLSAGEQSRTFRWPRWFTCLLFVVPELMTPSKPSDSLLCDNNLHIIRLSTLHGSVIL